MLDCIVEELNAIRKTRIEVYTDKVSTKREYKNDKIDRFELDLQDASRIKMDNKLYTVDAVVVENRKMFFIIYGEDGYDINSVIIDLEDSFIKIYETDVPGTLHFVETKFKEDQKINPEDIDLRKYPKIEFSVKDPDDLLEYKEVKYKVRMNPIDTMDYNIVTFVKKDLDNVLENIQYNMKLIEKKFPKFFTLKQIVFNVDFNLIRKSSVYDIVDHHYSEDAFAVKEAGNEESDVVLVPFVAVLNSILEYEE